MKIVFLLLILILGACSSSSKKDVSDLKNTDFKKPAPIKYKVRDDKLYADKTNLSGIYSESIRSNSEDNQEKILEGNDLVTKVISLCYSNKFNEAKPLIVENSSAQLKNPSFWNAVGICYQSQNQKRLATLYYNKALEIDPDYTPALNNFGIMYLHEKSFSKAKVFFEKSVKSSSKSHTPKYNLAQINLNQGQPKIANKLFEELYASDMKNNDFLVGYAASSVALGQYQKAIKLYERLPKDYFELPYVGTNYAYALKRTGDADKANDILDDIEVDDKNNEQKIYLNMMRN